MPSPCVNKLHNSVKSDQKRCFARRGIRGIKHRSFQHIKPWNVLMRSSAECWGTRVLARFFSSFFLTLSSYLRKNNWFLSFWAFPQILQPTYVLYSARNVMSAMHTRRSKSNQSKRSSVAARAGDWKSINHEVCTIIKEKVGPFHKAVAAVSSWNVLKVHIWFWTPFQSTKSFPWKFHENSSIISK